MLLVIRIKYHRNSKMQCNNKDNNLDMDNAQKNIFRYKFTDEFTGEMFQFSKIHQYDHRKEFKEAWDIWVEDNSNIIDEEVRRLTNLGYEGDILDKMYKSARYYFRKKSTEKKQPAQRRKYVSADKELIDAMDEHIREHIHQVDYKPSEGFMNFCEINDMLIKDEVKKLSDVGFADTDTIKNKIKKTYKNRYFLLISK